MDEIFNKPNQFRALTGDETALLGRQSNTAADWNAVRVAEGFDAGKVRNCSFDGHIEIGSFTLDHARHENVTLKIGLYGSNFRNVSIGGNPAIHNLLYCGEQRIGNSVIISNAGEISSFGDGDAGGDFGMCGGVDSLRPIHIINENGGRSILISPEMTCTGAFIWANYRDDKELMARLREITFNSNNALRPPKAVISDNAVIVNTRAIRSSLIGPAAIIDGAELIHNSTVMSEPSEKTYIGPAAQIRNSIIGYGNIIDSAAQLDSVMTGTAVTLSKAARVTHSFIGDNSAIACGEVANCLVMPSHGQHHNNSFLIAAAAGGQSNIAAGATIGSNHNSRAADGEIWAKRGFWPGLCVSLKHNSRFASFTMIAKGDYRSELDVKLPFSLVALDKATGSAAVYPAFWFTHNMYAVMRCAQKFVSRDKRVHRRQHIEHEIFAPDTVEEMFEALQLIEFNAVNIERGRAETPVKRADDAVKMYKMMIRHYCAKSLLPYMRKNGIGKFEDLLESAAPLTEDCSEWLNCGSLVITETALASIISQIKDGAGNDTEIADAPPLATVNNNDGATEPGPTGKINTWAGVNALFDAWTSSACRAAKIRHAILSLAGLEGVHVSNLTAKTFASFLQHVPRDCEMIIALTLSSRSKDFSDPFRKMAYRSREEMDAVLGPVSDAVIRQVVEEMEELSSLANFYLKNVINY